MGLPIPSDMAAGSAGATMGGSVGAFGPSAPFLPSTAASGSSATMHQSAAMPDMPSDINVEEARYATASLYTRP